MILPKVTVGEVAEPDISMPNCMCPGLALCAALGFLWEAAKWEQHREDGRTPGCTIHAAVWHSYSQSLMYIVLNFIIMCVNVMCEGAHIP